PNGVVARTGNYEGGLFDPPPDFGKLAESVNGYGETVREPEALAEALRRGLDAVRKGSPAIISAYLPTVVEEMSLAKSGNVASPNMDYRTVDDMYERGTTVQLTDRWTSELARYRSRPAVVIDVEVIGFPRDISRQEMAGRLRKSTIASIP